MVCLPRCLGAMYGWFGKVGVWMAGGVNGVGVSGWMAQMRMSGSMMWTDVCQDGLVRSVY